jgi:hypothetical protein
MGKEEGRREKEEGIFKDRWNGHVMGAIMWPMNSTIRR